MSGRLRRRLSFDQAVIGLDNFSFGKKENLREVQSLVSMDQWKRFTFIEGDIRVCTAVEEAPQRLHMLDHDAGVPAVGSSGQRH